MVAVRGDDVASAPFGLEAMLAHQAAQLLAVHHHALVAQGGADAPIAVTLELVADVPIRTSRSLAATGGDGAL
jgi:hypothetical protein